MNRRERRSLACTIRLIAPTTRTTTMSKQERQQREELQLQQQHQQRQHAHQKGQHNRRMTTSSSQSGSNHSINSSGGGGSISGRSGLSVRTRRSASCRAGRLCTRDLFKVFCILFMLHAVLQALFSLPMHAKAEAVTNYVDELHSEQMMVVGRSAHEPKFGERLLPLRKKHLSANLRSAVAPSTTTTTTTSTSTTTTTTESSVQRSHAQSDLINLSEMLVPQQAPNNSQALHKASLVYTLAEVPTRRQSMRQSKQLNRREDVNIMDVQEHVELVPTAAVAAPMTNISKADRLVEMSTEFFVIPTMSTSSTTTKTTARPANGRSHNGSPARIQPSPSTGTRTVHTRVLNKSNHTVTPPTIVSTHSTFNGLRKEPWVVPVLVLSSLTILMMAAFEVFVLFKAWRTSPSRRHLFLGQMLLLGLFACAALAAIITAQPTLLSCGTIRFGVGVAYALVFAALLVKCVFLISLNGGVYLPAPYQGLLLFFAVLIQVAIGAQWLITNPAETYMTSVPIVGNNLLASTVASSTQIFNGYSGKTNLNTNYLPNAATTYTTTTTTSGNADLYTRISAVGTVLIPLCKTQFSELLFSLIYIIFLIVFVAVLAIKSRGVRDNYREATYIGLAIGGAIPIWLGWMLCGLAVAERHKDACIAFGLIATSATVFLVMFMPKGRQLAAMGKEGFYMEDREEQFSSLSRAGSGYSPSFFHFKPIKYGVMGTGNGAGGVGAANVNANGNGGIMQNPTITNVVSGKHATNGGERIALVTTAAPPSYTRIYHYFPAQPYCFYPQPPPPPPPPLPPPPPMTQLTTPLTIKQLGTSLASMTQAQIAHTLRYPGLFIRPDDNNLYTTLEPTLSSNPNVFFQRSGAVHPGMMY